MYDRDMRQRQEFAVMRMRLRQADLWREDVRDLIGLTEKRMDSYMIVNALQLGFTITLFTEGRLEPGTPEWLLWLYMLSTLGAFLFLLMAVWFAMHASVVAQGSSVRLLTQLVRPAVPSWHQVEAMRTYGYAFEGMPARHMLRVPILQTVSEGVEGGAGGHSGHHDAPPGTAASDPWGLERRGDDIYELQRRPITSQRHIKLVREAMRHSQAYDAFARVSMTLGTILECNALLYYILGYALVQDGSPWAAWVAGVVFLAVASTILQLDVAMTRAERRFAQVFLLGGPTLASIAAAQWSTYQDSLQRLSWTLLPGAYFFHTAFLLLFVRLCHVERQSGGLMLPMSFRSILYLDVFGWLTRGGTAKGQELKATMLAYGGARDGRDTFADCESAETESMVTTPSTLEHAGDSRHCIRDAQNRRRLQVVHGQNFPRHFDKWKAVALRPEDVDTALLEPDDKTGGRVALQEASRHLLDDLEEFDNKDPDHVLHGIGPIGVIPAASERTFAATSFSPQMPPRTADLGRGAGGGGRAKLGERLQSTREIYSSGELPWIVFRGAVLALASFWFVGGVWVVCQLNGVPDIPDQPLPESVEITGAASDAWARNRGGVMTNPRIDSLDAYFPAGERILTDWPHDRFQPWGLTCDPTGQHFVFSDEFQLYIASLSEASSAPAQGATAGSGGQPELRLGALQSAPRCPSLEGQAMRDVGLVCQARMGQAPLCEALVLHEHGTRLAQCVLPQIQPRPEVPAELSERDLIDVPELSSQGASRASPLPAWLGSPGGAAAAAAAAASADGFADDEEHAARVWEISSNWLRMSSDGLREEVVSLAIDFDCNRSSSQGLAQPQLWGRLLALPETLGGEWCPVVGTTQGRTVRLRRHREESGKLVPSDALWNILGSLKPNSDEVLATSVLHVLPGGVLVKLSDERRSVQAMNMATGSVLGEWRLPEHSGHSWSALAAGGTHVYLTSQSANGDDANLWRFPLPPDLHA